MTIYHSNPKPSADGEESLSEQMEHNENWFQEEQDMAREMNDNELFIYEER